MDTGQRGDLTFPLLCGFPGLVWLFGVGVGGLGRRWEVCTASVAVWSGCPVQRAGSHLILALLCNPACVFCSGVRLTLSPGVASLLPTFTLGAGILLGQVSVACERQQPCWGFF